MYRSPDGKYLWVSNLNGSIIVIEINEFKIENEKVFNNKIENKNLHNLINNNNINGWTSNTSQKQVETMQNGKRKIKPIM